MSPAVERFARARSALVLVLALTPGAVLAAAPAPGPPPASPAPSAEEPDEDRASEVVVTGRRKPPPPPGAVVGDIKPEESLSPADIASYGVSTVTELLQELSPETRSDRGRGGESPVVLLNGRRISGFNEIQNIPTEAILRVDILPEEVALKYGYSANQRVVNIVLRRRFRAITGEGQAGGPTEGAQVSGTAEADLLHILRDDRLNLDLKYSQSSSLLESDRNLVSTASGEPYDAVGNITAPVSGAQIDPALSALAGRPVTVVGAPATAATRALTLADLVPGANMANVTDVGRDRTLLPSTKSVAANAVLARTLPFGISGTGNVTLGATTSDTLQGLAGLPLTLSPGDPFSPFAEPVVVDRYATALGPLRQSVEGWTAHLGSTLNRDVGKWRLSLTDAYDHADTTTDTQTGVDPTALQALLDARSPALNPFGALPASSLARLPEQKARSTSNSGNVQVLGNGPLLDVPAGQLYASVKAGDTESLLDTSSERLDVDQSLSLSRNDLSAQVNLDLPLTSREEHMLAFAGDLSVNVNAAVDQLSDFGVLRTLGYGVNWTPVTGVTFIVSRTQDQAAPSQSQLGAPVTITPGVRTFDYLTGRTVDVTQVNGGTQGLAADHRSVTKVGLTWKPIATQQLSITANYIDSRIRNPIETFPAATAEIEAAFPDRFTRDASGELVQVDERPLNFERQDRSEIRYGFDYSRPIGPQPQSRFGRGGGQRGEGGGERRGGGEGGGGYGGGRGGGGGGRGGGGGFGGGGGGAGGFRPPGGRLQIAVYHTVLFTDRMLVRPGGPVFDLLDGSAAGNTGGAPRQEVEAQLGYTYAGFGARLSADWKSATFVRGAPGSPTGDLDFSDIGTINLRLFANVGQMPALVARHGWLRGVRLTFSGSNLFDARIRVRDAQGVTPLIYQPDYLDPAGRTLRFSLRKLFF